MCLVNKPKKATQWDYSSWIGLLSSVAFLRLRGVDLRAPACRGPLSDFGFSTFPEVTSVWAGGEAVTATVSVLEDFSIRRCCG